MTEASGEIGRISESVEVLEPQVAREVLYVDRESHGGLLSKGFDPSIVKNQEQFGRGVDDAAAMTKAHEGFGETGLGVRETTVRQFTITVGGEKIAVQDAIPSVRTTWVGDEHVRIMTADEASKVEHGGQTALDWATYGRVAPERVVKAQNRLFYPASSRDNVVVVDKPPQK